MINKQPIDLDFDREHIWHPYTSMTEPLPVYPVSHANANRIFTKSDSDSVVVPELHYYNFPTSAINGLKVSASDDFNRTALVLRWQKLKQW